MGRPAPPALLFVQDEGQAPLVLNVAKTTISGDFSLQGLAACGVPFYSSCVLTVTFTPTASGIRTGMLTIASNDPSLPTISVPLEAVGYAAAPVPQITSLNSQLVQAGAAGTNLSVRGYGFLPSSIVEVGGVPQPTTYDSDTALGATLAASSIPANSYGELAVTVVTPAPGGGTSAPYTLTEFQLISAANVFMIYEPVSKQLFTSTPAAATANPNTVVPINPVTATVGTPIPVGNDPGVLAASADGKYLYVGLNADHTIQRINLSTSAIERTFPLPVDPTFGKLTVFDMHVVPGSDTEVAASLMGSFSPGEEGIALFNDAGLVNWIPSLSLTGQTPTVSVDRFTFTNSPSTLYAIVPSHPGFAELTYSSAGLEYAGASCCVPAFRRSRRTRSPASVIDMTTSLPSSGSEARSARPRASRPASVAPIDCGLICSSLASAADVAGPPRSRRERAELSGSVSSPLAFAWRSRRTSSPMLIRSAPATWATSRSWSISSG